MINNPAETEATIEAMAEVINKDSAIKAEDHSSGLSVPRSAGGYYEGCLVSDVNLYSGRIVLRVSFLMGDDLSPASKEIDITSYNLAQFERDNYPVLSSF